VKATLLAVCLDLRSPGGLAREVATAGCGGARCRRRPPTRRRLPYTAPIPRHSRSGVCTPQARAPAGVGTHLQQRPRGLRSGWGDHVSRREVHPYRAGGRHRGTSAWLSL